MSASSLGGRQEFFYPSFHVIDHNSSVFWSFIKLGKKAGGTNVLVPGCAWITMTILAGVGKKTKDLHFTLLVVFYQILYLAIDIQISYTWQL